MLTPQDDLIGHQLPTTFDQIDNSDPAWMERLWYTGHPAPGGEVMFDIGLGYHPNRNVMDAFAGIAVPGHQWNFRVSRRLRPDPLTTTVGPLSIQVIEGLRRHRLALADNESGISFDIEFHATLNPHEEKAHLRRRDGRVTENMARGQQMGRYTGWLQWNGKRMDVANWLGQRDHSWGVRAEMRTDETTPPQTFYPPFFYCWTTAQFKDRGLVIFFKERAPDDKIYLSGEEVFSVGSRASSRNQLVDARHEVTWKNDPHGQTMDRAVFHLRFADGRERAVQVRALETRYFLKGGLYGGLEGWFHGDDKGKLFSAHEHWDLGDAAIRKKVRTLADQLIEVRDGDDVGYGIIEYGVGKGFEMYPEVQEHPPI
ncbi:hypothetical protein J7E70_16065 [Variovorax paradoxus]|nr:hypothetical protein [Variovorax paradoxus]MBT2301979.1 hypothetical protein [Variovorax paradoxus]